MMFTPPQTNNCPLRINGWEMKSPFQMVPFVWDIIFNIFLGGVIEYCVSQDVGGVLSQVFEGSQFVLPRNRSIHHPFSVATPKKFAGSFLGKRLN